MENTSLEIDKALRGVTSPVAVAVSGGPDSLGLLILANKWAKKHQNKIIGLTVDHKLRPDSTKEALDVQKYLQSLNVEHHILTWEGPKPNTHVQEYARFARYQLLKEWCKTNNVSFLLLGHHRQDQEETFWMRLASGSGLDGLSGIKTKTVIDGITLIRPLLQFSKEQIKQVLKEINATWINDPSNHKPSFFRSRFRDFVREEGLNQNRLINVMHKLSIDSDFIHENLCNAIEQVVRLHESGYITIDKKAFSSLHIAISQRLISHLMMWFSGSNYPPRNEKVVGVIEKLKMGKPFTAGSIHWSPKKNLFVLKRELNKNQTALSLNSIKNDLVWDHRFIVKANIREVLGDNTDLAPLGRQPWLRKEIQTDIPYSVWPTLPSLWQNAKIVSVPHLCYNPFSELDYRKFFILKSFLYGLK